MSRVAQLPIARGNCHKQISRDCRLCVHLRRKKAKRIFVLIRVDLNLVYEGYDIGLARQYAERIGFPNRCADRC